MIELSPQFLNVVLTLLLGAIAVWIRAQAMEKRQFIEMVAENRAELAETRTELAAMKKNYEGERERNNRLEERLRTVERELTETRTELAEVIRERDVLKSRLRDIEKAQSNSTQETKGVKDS